MAAKIMKLGIDVLVHLIYPWPPGFLIAAREYNTRPVGATPSTSARNKNLVWVVQAAARLRTAVIFNKHAIKRLE